MADTPHRLEKPLSELMRSMRCMIDGAASGAVQLDMSGVKRLAETARTAEMLINEQERQAQPAMTAGDWLGRVEFQIRRLRERMTEGSLDNATIQSQIEAAIQTLVVARVAAGKERR